MVTRQDEWIAAAYIDWCDNKKETGTRDHRKTHLKRFLDWLRVNNLPGFAELDAFEIEDHIDDIRDTHTNMSVLNRFDAISSFYNWLTDEKQQKRLEKKLDTDVSIKDDPTTGILSEYDDIEFETRKSQVYDHDIVALTRDDAAELTKRENMPKPKTRNQLLIKLMIETGIRVSEIRTIELDKINHAKQRIRVNDVKTGGQRTVFYQANTQPLMYEWCGDGGFRSTYSTAADSEYLFLTYKKPQMTRSAIGQIVREAAHKAGVQDDMYEDAAGNTRWKVTPHTLRHTMARFAVTGEDRMDVSRLARLMGHTDKHGNPNVETTQKYLAFREEDLKQAARTCIPSF